jgi:hypothetical protein
MSLTFGNSNKTAFRFSEGSEIVLNCSIRANPNVSVVRWTHNSQEIWYQTNGMLSHLQFVLTMTDPLEANFNEFSIS